MRLGRLPSGGLKEADCCEAGEDREPKKRSWLPLGKVRCTIDEVAEAPVPDFLRGIFDIFGRELMPRAANGTSFSKA